MQIMEHQKILNSLNEPKKFSISDKKMGHCQWLIKRKLWCSNEIVYKTEVLKSNLCDCNDTYILVTGSY